MNPDYVMGWQASMEISRLQDFVKGGMDLDDITLLLQDCIEAGVLQEIHPRFHVAAMHYTDIGLCTGLGRYLQ